MIPLVKVTVSLPGPANCKIDVCEMVKLLKVIAPACVALLFSISSVRFTSVSEPQVVVLPSTSIWLPPSRLMLRSDAVNEAPVCRVPPFNSTVPTNSASLPS